MNETIESPTGYGVVESLGWLEEVLAGALPREVAKRSRCSSPNALAYAILAAIVKTTTGLAKEGKRLDLVIVEVADGPK